MLGIVSRAWALLIAHVSFFCLTANLCVAALLSTTPPVAQLAPAQAQDALAAAEAGREALQQQVQDAAVAVRGLKQRLTDAQLGLTAAQAREGELSRQGAQLEGELQAAAAEAQSCRQALGEARERQQGAERRVGSLEQQLEIAQAQVRVHWGAGKGGGYSISGASSCKLWGAELPCGLFVCV